MTRRWMARYHPIAPLPFGCGQRLRCVGPLLCPAARIAEPKRSRHTRTYDKTASDKTGAPGTMKSSRMTTYILVAMVLGIAVGGLIHSQSADPATHKLFA